MSESYLNTAAQFKKGQADGVNGTIGVLTSIINGTDVGVHAVSNRELEKVRRVLLMWRDYIIESKAKDRRAMEILVETKKVMDIKIPRSVM